MQLSLYAAALFACAMASPVAEPNFGNECTTKYWYTTKTITKTETSTSTNACPIVSLPNVPILTSLGVTGTLIPVGSILSPITGGLTGVLGRDAEPTDA